MFRASWSGSLRTILPRPRYNVSGFVSSSSISTPHPNSPLNLDPSLQALLKDVDMSLVNHKTRHLTPPPPPRELEVFPFEETLDGEVRIPESPDEVSEDHVQRKSPAAHFGSRHIGAVVLPFELQKSINLVISESDKPQLHNDAKRLFYDDDGGVVSDPQWEAKYDARYRSRRQAARHFERDGTAFVSVALPAHYAAILSVFDHVKRRLEPGWKVHRVVDWGAGTGSGLWASLYSFQTTPHFESETPVDGLRIANSSVITYLGIEKREGLVTIGKRLLRSLDLGRVSLTWQKSFQNDDKIRRSEGHDTLALSAFMLSSLPTALARKTLVKEMWESGAHVLVLIDHNTTAGFECIAEAREYLLNVGRKEFADPDTEGWDIRGSHVVAPCPHDGACPLYHPGSSRLVCGFSQRLQRPPFVRLTKHSSIGHEDVEYSYVVVRRGSRPFAGDVKVGRIGEVGKRAMDKEATSQAPVKELKLHGEHDDACLKAPNHFSPPVPAGSISNVLKNEPKSRSELEAALRLEAFSWPRLVFPPMKKSGHIILDSCTAEGKIMRLTIPKSQGKQPYYDARKSSWGDLFPHEPKNAPQERYQPLRAKREGGTTPTKGADIGKRRGTERQERPSYQALSDDLKERKKKTRRDRIYNLKVQQEEY